VATLNLSYYKGHIDASQALRQAALDEGKENTTSIKSGSSGASKQIKRFKVQPTTSLKSFSWN